MSWYNYVGKRVILPTLRFFLRRDRPDGDAAILHLDEEITVCALLDQGQEAFTALFRSVEVVLDYAFSHTGIR